jgi:tRNA threonylcarbamoyladenosine biosynthesis protein TsaE
MPDACPDVISVLTVDVSSAEAMHDLGARLAALLRAGDLVVLIGDLGAGKTTLTQGIGAGLGVRGPVASPTFVISRVHPSLGSGPPLVHVDAYRLGGRLELDDLDLDTTLDVAVTVVEWGQGLAEALSPSRLEIVLQVRPPQEPHDSALAESGGDREVEVEDRQPRSVTVRAVGPRWVEESLASLG